MRTQAHDPATAYRDDAFLHAHMIKPFFLDELAGPVAPPPSSAPVVSTAPVRRAPAGDGCLEFLLKVFVIVAGSLLVSMGVIYGLMRVWERIISAGR